MGDEASTLNTTQLPARTGNLSEAHGCPGEQLALKGTADQAGALQTALCKANAIQRGTEQLELSV